MQKFLKNILRFLAILMCYFGSISAINIWIYKSQPLQIIKTNILIAGDSHTKRSLDPKLFSSAQNISQVSEPYIITFWKLKKFFKTHTPDTLLLGFAPHNISAFNDYKFTDKKWSNEMFKRSYPIEDFESLKDVIPVDYSSYYKTLLKEIAFYPKKDHIKYIGSYANSEKSNLSKWEFSIDRHYYREEKELGYSPISISYLDSIIVLCTSKNVVPILVNSPTHNNYFSNIPDTFKEKYISLQSNYKNQAFIVDMMDSHYPDSLFYDVDHVNKYGAKKFTLELKGLLKRGK